MFRSPFLVLSISFLITIRQNGISAAATSSPTQITTRPPVIVPERFPVSLHRAIKNFNASQYQQALRALDDTKDTPADTRNLLKGIILWHSGKRAEAGEPLAASLRNRPGNADALYYLGLVLSDAHEFDKAVQQFEEALWFGKLKIVSPAIVYYQIGLSYQQTKKLGKASENFGRALSLDPQLTSAAVHLASIEIEQGNAAQAVTRLREAISKNPNDSDLKRELARALLTGSNPTFNKREIAEAREILDELLHKNSKKISYDDPSLTLYLKALITVGELTKAEKLLLKAARARPNDPELGNLSRQLEIEKRALEASSPN